MQEPSPTDKRRKFKAALGHRSLVVGAVAVAAVATAVPVAGGFGEGAPLEGGERNPSPNQSLELQRETEIIANTSTYGTRQSNKSNSGGGAIYGCRSGAGGTAANNEPCLRASNLRQGFGFEFATKGPIAGLISAGKGGPETKPFTTNATGIANGLNADFVHGQQFDAAAVAANGQLEVATQPVAATRTDTGTYQVDFPAPAGTTCFYQATARSGPAFVVVDGLPAPPHGRAAVTTYRVGEEATATPDDGATTGASIALDDFPFYITAQCVAAGAATTP